YTTVWGRMASCAPVGNRRCTCGPASFGRRVTNPPQVSNLPHKLRKVHLAEQSLVARAPQEFGEKRRTQHRNRPYVALFNSRFQQAECLVEISRKGVQQAQNQWRRRLLPGQLFGPDQNPRNLFGFSLARINPGLNGGKPDVSGNGPRATLQHLRSFVQQSTATQGHA